MQPGSRSRVRRRAVTTLASSVALVVTGWTLPVSAQAIPTTGLDPGAFLALPDGAIDVQTARSRGDSVAYLYSVEDDTDIRRLWVRTKAGAAWADPVLVSHPERSAYHPSIDVLGGGAALVAWEEDLTGSPDQIVVRRVDGSSAGARREIAVDPYDGPYVSSGPTRDVVAWTRYSVDAHKAFAAVAPTGGAFGPEMPVSDPGWSGAVVDGTLSVSADAGRLHALFLKRDDNYDFYLPAWATYDAISSPSWEAFELTNSYQDTSSATPQLGVDGGGHAVLAVADEIDGWHGETYVFHPPPPETVELPDFDVRDHLSDPVELGDGPAYGMAERGAAVDALLSGTVPVSARVLPSTGSGVQVSTSSASRPECVSAPWVLADTDFVCADHPDPYGSAVEIWSEATGLLGDLTPSDGATQVTVSVPGPEVPLMVVKESRSGPDPQWILDLSSDDGGSPPPPPPPPPAPAPAPVFVMTEAPKITGKTLVGRKLRARAGTWQPAPGQVAYLWYVGKKAIKAATGPRLKLKGGYAGKRVKVRIIVSHDGYPSVVRVVRAKGKVRAP